jgi:hypothetical protein
LQWNRQWKPEAPEGQTFHMFPGHIAELSGGASALENVTIGGIDKQRNEKAAADGE